jgi:hypothetical protein
VVTNLWQAFCEHRVVPKLFGSFTFFWQGIEMLVGEDKKFLFTVCIPSAE